MASVLMLWLAACQNAPSGLSEQSPSNTVEPPIAEPESTTVTTPIEVESEKQSSATATQAVANLWDIIDIEQRWRDWSHTSVDKEYDKLIKHKHQLKYLTQQAQPWLYYIYEQLKARNMPIELVFLPMIESAYDPLAYSPGGAAGLWQFMPRTGRHFKLHENSWYNGRRDIIASTDAALDYLESLYSRFGNWHLALAAYNAGQGNVAKAMRRNKRQGKATDYWSLKLPLETRQYVPRLIAWTKLLHYHNHTIFHPIHNQPYFAVVDIGSQLDLTKAATMAQLEPQQLLTLNPCFYRWASPPEGPHRLLIPYNKVSHFKQALLTLPKEERMQWTEYRVRRGDSLSEIAVKHNVTVKRLKTHNKLQNNTIRIGQQLVIPLVQNAQINDFHRRHQPMGKPVIYRVKNGDSFWSIAQLYGVSIKQIARWNNLSPKAYLQPKQRLKIWPGGRS